MIRPGILALLGSVGIVMVCPGRGVAENLSRSAKEQLVREAKTLLEAGQYEAARAKWSAALAGASRSEARRWRPELGRAYEAEGNFQKALAAYQEAFDADPKNVDRIVDLARLYDVLGIDEQAKRFYAQAHARDKNRRDVSLALAKLYRQSARLDEARALAESAVRADAGDFYGQAILADIEAAQGDLAAAARRWESILSLHPTAEGYMTAGRLWARQDAFEQADLAFAHAEEAGFPGAEPGFERAVLDWRSGKRAAAKEKVERLMRSAPSYFPGGFLQGLLALEDGHPEATLKLLAGFPAPDPEAGRWKALLESAARKKEGGKP